MNTETTDTTSVPTLYCSNHPQKPTLLRCNRCDKPICSTCAIKTPVGYRCKECVRSQQKIFNNTKSWDYPIALVLGAIMAAVCGLVTLIGFFTLFVTPVIGVAIAEVIRWATCHRRSPTLHKITVLGVALGTAPLMLYDIIMAILWLNAGYGLWNVIAPLVWQSIYTVIVISTVYARFPGRK